MTTTTASLAQRVDLTIDQWFESLRGHPIWDRTFATASHLGDWGLIWVLLTLAQGLRSDAAAARIPRLVTLFATESLIVNQGIKRLFGRTRPGARPEVSVELREPLTSSFPSGHASSAAFATLLLTDGDPSLRAIVFPTAVIVAASRIHTRMHHPTDVLAGAGVGLVLGTMARRLWPDLHARKSSGPAGRME